MTDWLAETDKENDILPLPAKKTKKAMLLESRFGNKVTTEEECASIQRVLCLKLPKIIRNGL